MAERFSQLLMREQIKRRIYTNRDLTRQGIFEYIEMLNNPIYKHGNIVCCYRMNSIFFIIQCLGGDPFLPIAFYLPQGSGSAYQVKAPPVSA